MNPLSKFMWWWGVIRLIDITDTMLDLFELLRGADNTRRLWELVQQPGAIEVLMHSANTPQVLLLNTWYNKLMWSSYIFCLAVILYMYLFHSSLTSWFRRTWQRQCWTFVISHGECLQGFSPPRRAWPLTWQTYRPDFVLSTSPRYPQSGRKSLTSTPFN